MDAEGGMPEIDELKRLVTLVEEHEGGDAPYTHKNPSKNKNGSA